MDGPPVQAILFLGIIPALILLYISLKGYEGYYRDKTIFLMFVIGIILGLIAAIVRLLIYPPFTYLVFIILFSFLEQLLKTIVLNIKKFQLKKETTIYGLTIGLGFGSSFTPFLIITMTKVSGQSSVPFLSLIIFGAIGFIFFHSATGAYIGYGIYSGKLTKYIIISILLLIPFDTLVDLSRFYNDPVYPFIQISILSLGFLVFLYVNKKVIPKILNNQEKRNRNKYKNKMAR